MALIKIGSTGLINSPDRFDASKFILPEDNLPSWQKGLDRATEDSITNQLDLASRSPEERANELMAGITQPKQPPQPEPSPLASASMDTVRDAISRRSQRDVNENLGRMRRSATINNEAQRGDDLARASKNIGAAQSIRVSNYKARLEYADTLRQMQLMEEQARAGIIGQILGGVGAVMGFGIAGAGGKALASAATPKSVTAKSATEDAFASLA